MASNWALHLIGCDPEVQAKVHQELDDIFGKATLNETQPWILKGDELFGTLHQGTEALRIFPSVPVFGRSLTEATSIGGVMFEKGTSLLIAPAAIQRDKKYYPEPEKFNLLDRFLLENSANRHPFAYIPFSAGGRNCIGQKFALLEEKVILSTILRNFSVTSMQERNELDPLAELILRPEHGIKVVLSKRQ